MSVPRYLIPPTNKPRYYYEPGLGLSALPSAGLAVATGGTSSLISSALGVVSSFLGPFGSIFSGSDPKKDAERKGRIDGYYAGAMAGNADDLARLQCMAGEITPQGDMIGLTQCSPNDPLGHAAGSAVARGYARAKLGEYKARVAAGQVGAVLIDQSNIPSTIAGTIGRAVSNPMVLLGGAALVVGAYLVLRKRR